MTCQPTTTLTAPEPGAVRCWLCGDPLHKVANTRLDEFVWVDAAGQRFGPDADLRHLPGGPDARLAWLRGELDRGTRQAKRRAEHTWLYWARAREYSSLKVRLDVAGTFHEHQARATDQPPYVGTVPEHCGWPMWRRPSGWHCRQCPHTEEAK